MGLFKSKNLIETVNLPELAPESKQMATVTKSVNEYIGQHEQYKAALTEVDSKLTEARDYHARIMASTEDTDSTVESFWQTLLNFTRFKGRNKNDHNIELLEKEKAFLEQFWNNKQAAIVPELSRQLMGLVLDQQQKLDDFLQLHETMGNTAECAEIASAIIDPVNELVNKAKSVKELSSLRHIATIRDLRYIPLQERQKQKYRTEAAYAKSFREQGVV
ncbi:hypothetical protein [Enterococcus sp. AZ072]|uniref:hypothetical protein n=1 Tax=unclassified Enterococcus TaxID=2608891 RepID=UPI003D2827C4